MVVNNINSNTTKTDLTTTIGKLKLKNPVLCASGTFGYADEFEDFVDLQNIGAVITKGITLEPRRGNPQPRLNELENGLINCIGLENIGINAFIEKKIPILTDKKIGFIVNVAGFSFEEYFEIARICQQNGIKAIELNVSCPNVKTGCLEFGTSSETLYRLVSEVRNLYDGTLIVKLTPNVTDPAELAIKTQQAGADAISAINTVKALAVNLNISNGKIKIQKIKGGFRVRL